MAKFKGQLATVVLGIAAAFGAPVVAHAVDQGKVRVVVAFKEGASAKALAAIAAAGGKVVLDLSELNAAAVMLPRSAVAALKASKYVAYLQDDVPRHALQTVTPSGPPYMNGQLVPYGIHMVQADQLPDTFAANRTICIIDSGMDGTHEDLQGIPITGENFTASGDWNTDELHHGTHVTGTIAAINNTGIGVVGVNPNKHLKLRMEKVFDASDSATSSVIAKAMIACGRNKANVVTMSLGGASDSPIEHAAATFLDKKGILVIAAAGNAGDSSISYPAGLATVVSVAALDVNKNWATFSQTNADVELAGPGVSVYSTVPMGTGTNTALTVGGVAYPDALGMDGTPIATVTAPLYNYGLGEVSDPGAAGKICLIARGDIAFSAKVLSCQADHGVGAIIYNNVAGPLNGTMSGVVTAIPSVGASDTDGAALLTKVGQAATIAITATNYAYLDGTSMATPHVSAVAALVWSYFPSCTHDQIRTSLDNSAMDLGDAGRDVKFGFGLVQARAAYDRITAKGCGV